MKQVAYTQRAEASGPPADVRSSLGAVGLGWGAWRVPWGERFGHVGHVGCGELEGEAVGLCSP